MGFIIRQDGVRGCRTNLIKNDGTPGRDALYAPCENTGGKYAIEVDHGIQKVGNKSNMYMSGEICGETANCQGMEDFIGTSYTQAPRAKNEAVVLSNILDRLLSKHNAPSEKFNGIEYHRAETPPSGPDIVIIGSSTDPTQTYFNGSLVRMFDPNDANTKSLIPGLLRKFNEEKNRWFAKPFTLYMVLPPTEGGARRKSKTPKNKAPKWVSTGRRVALKDGSKRVVFQNNSGTGELRYKKYVVRAGKRVATYVKFK